MSITSLVFIVFLLAVLVLYYVVPKKFQWCVLLAASLGFYLAFSIKCILYVLITATSIYFATRGMQGLMDRQKAYIKANKETLTKEDKTRYKAQIKKQRKTIMLVTLILNIGILCAFKYVHFAVDQINAIAGLFGRSGLDNTFSILVPLGISFYTFQATGYLIDVYWEYYEAERNYAKVLLFVSFFPQMTQGPISDFSKLSKELFSEHLFEYKNYSYGAMRVMWGFFKKMAVANVVAPTVSNVFANYSTMSGIATFVGALLYSLQIYADFSGYMDIMCGFCEMLGIRLSENFMRPYFSKSIAEYWRRWHITLGEWFKKYIYYPIGMSNWSRKLAKNTRERFGKHFSDSLPASIALVVTWLATGLWHGASWAYIAWGLVNGLFIIASLWLEPVYGKVKHGLRINENAWIWRAFQTIRTFILVTFIKVLPEVGTLKEGLGLWGNIFKSLSIPHGIHDIIPIAAKSDMLIVFLGAAMMFVVSLLQRRGSVRKQMERIPYVVRILAFVVLVLITVYFGAPASENGGGFMYAQF